MREPAPRPGLVGRIAVGGALLALVACGGRATQDAPPPVETSQPPAGEPEPYCSDDAGFDSIGIDVKLDGTARSLVLSRGGWADFQDRCFSILFDNGRALLHGVGAGPFDRTGEIPKVLGWLFLNGEVGEPPQWLCGEALSVALRFEPLGAGTRIERLSVSGNGWRDLRRCPGTPVPGTIRWHWQGGVVPTSTVEGIVFTEVPYPVAMGRPALAAAEATGDCAFVSVRWDAADAGGFVLTSPSAPDPGALYCIGKVTDLGNGELELSDISRVGRCAEARPSVGTATVTACY